MKNRWWKKIVAVMTMGCMVGAIPTVVAAQEKADVTLAVWQSGAAENYKAAADEFNQRQDAVNFTVEMESGDYTEWLTAKMASNSLPDMFFLNPFNQVRDFAANGRIQSLNDQAFVENLYDSSKNSVSYEGEVYGIPFGQLFWGIFYNMDLFEQCGIEKVPTIFTELTEDCKILNENGITPFASTYKEVWACEQIFATLMGNVLQDKQDAWVEEMNGDKGSYKVDGIDHVFQFIDLLKENSGSNYMDSDSSSGYNSFANGEAAMICLGEFALLQARDVNPNIRVGLFPCPVDDSGNAKLIVNNDCVIVVNSEVKNQEAVQQVIDYLTDCKDDKGWNQINFNSYGASMPAMGLEFDLTEIADEPYYQDAVKYIGEGAALTKTSPQLPTGTPDMLGDVVQGYFAGTMTQEEVLSEIDAQVASFAEE